jgi:hypothetical protein
MRRSERRHSPLRRLLIHATLMMPLHSRLLTICLGQDRLLLWCLANLLLAAWLLYAALVATYWITSLATVTLEVAQHTTGAGAQGWVTTQAMRLIGGTIATYFGGGSVVSTSAMHGLSSWLSDKMAFGVSSYVAQEKCTSTSAFLEQVQCLALGR